MEICCKFATREELLSIEFESINNRLAEINKKFSLSDHSDINNSRFPWAEGKYNHPCLYVSRMWEYPFAILSAELINGMKCADIGCGTSPFTILLSDIVGKNNVTGFDPDQISGKNIHSTFGANKSLLESLGINYCCNDMTKLDALDNSFDRVFCISVIEHIEEPLVWQKGLREMIRILKPGGRLIITMDLGINLPLTSPFDIIRYSGLSLCGSLYYKWPKERFFKIEEQSLDVFGLVLEKQSEPIFLNYDQSASIAQFEANKNFIPPILDSKQIQIGNDLRRKYSKLRIISKLLLGKYKL